MHFWYYKKDIKPSYLKPFEMMSCLVSPKSIGLTDSEDVYKLIKTSKTLHVISKICIIIYYVIGIILYSNLLFVKQSLIQLLFITIPWIISYGFWCYFLANFIVYQNSYFFIICYYLKIKIKSFNKEISTVMKSRKGKTRIQFLSIIRSFNSIHNEIKEFNENYWSEYLFVLISTIMTLINGCHCLVN